MALEKSKKDLEAQIDTLHARLTRLAEEHELMTYREAVVRDDLDGEVSSKVISKSKYNSGRRD